MRNVAAALAVFAMAAGCQAKEPSSQERLKGFPKPDKHPVTAELITEHVSVQPGGQTRIGVLFTLEPGWHIYAKEPGDAGLPTTIEWTAPLDATIGSVHYPAPKAFLDPGDIQTFGYDSQVLLWSPLSTQGASGELPVRAQVKWLACKDICIPGKAERHIAIPIRADPLAPTSHAPLFDKG